MAISMGSATQYTGQHNMRTMQSMMSLTYATIYHLLLHVWCLQVGFFNFVVSPLLQSYASYYNRFYAAKASKKKREESGVSTAGGATNGATTEKAVSSHTKEKVVAKRRPWYTNMVTNVGLWNKQAKEEEDMKKKEQGRTRGKATNGRGEEAQGDMRHAEKKSL